MSRAVQVRPWELVKINQADLVDRFSRKIGHMSGKLVHKSMVQAYNQALTDIRHLLMTAEKDTSGVESGPEVTEARE